MNKISHFLFSWRSLLFFSVCQALAYFLFYPNPYQPGDLLHQVATDLHFTILFSASVIAYYLELLVKKGGTPMG